MPPVRSSQKDTQPEASTSKHKKLFRKHGKGRAVDQDEQHGTPGVQKIKAALRQTRRLLAKEGLAADVRVEAERRLKALEHELSNAETARKERQMATRYHKIKFFEKKKVLRKIKQIKSQLESAESEKENKKLSAELQKQRINLNYILHYPKTEKYISLFPPEVRKEEPEAPTAESEKTAQRREAIRQTIKDQMQSGVLPTKPENEDAPRTRPKAARAPLNSQPKAKPSAKAGGLEEDEFFGSASEEEDS